MGTTRKISVLNKPPYKYNNKRKVIMNADDVAVMSMIGYSWLAKIANIPPKPASEDEDIFGELVAMMLNAETEN